MKVKMKMEIKLPDDDGRQLNIIEYNEILDFEKELSEDDLYEIWREWAGNFIGGGFNILDEKEE